MGLRRHRIHIQGRPQVKERPRFRRSGTAVITYTPEKTLKAERKIAEEWLKTNGPKFDGPVKLHLVFDKEGTEIIVEEVDGDISKLQGDLDNLLKLVGDGLQNVAYANDRQVTMITAVKL